MCNNSSRRKFLGQIGACTGYLAAAKYSGLLDSGYAYAATSCTAQNKVLVHLFLDGGMDSANFLVPRNIQAYRDKRPTIAINNSLIIDPRYGLNPALTGLYSLYQQGKVAIVNKVGYPNGSRSHEDSKNVYSSAIRKAGTGGTGWAGRFGDTYCKGNSNVTSIFSFRGAVKDVRAQSYVATTAGSLGSYNYTNDSDAADSRYRRELVKAMRGIEPVTNDQAVNLTNAWGVVDNSVSTLQSVNSGYTSPVTYANDGLSQRFRDAAKLIRSNENPSIILMSTGGYDTHGDELVQHTRLLGQLSAAISSFFADLRQMGRSQDVMIQVYTEFGRNTFENSTGGTDHGHGTVALTVGENVIGGVYGPDYTEADFASKQWLPGDVDFREVLAQAVEKHLKVDSAPIFPEAFTRTGLNFIS